MRCEPAEAEPIEIAFGDRGWRTCLVSIGGLLLALVWIAATGESESVRGAILGSLVVLGLCSCLWAYGALALCGRVYRITGEGVSLLRRGVEVEGIPGGDVAEVSRARWRVIARDGRAIVFRLPPAARRRALDEVERRWLRESRAERAGRSADRPPRR